jgi:uncharacterized protein (TIGR00645 family)
MIERFIERLIFGARWLMAPLYLGLALVLGLLGVRFFVETWHMLGYIFSANDADIVLITLSLLDLVMVANLVVMVMLSGYENFISRIEVAEGVDKPTWMGKLDAATIKLKLAISIVAIASIHLLKQFMNINNIANDKLILTIATYLAFVVGALFLAYVDKIAFDSHRGH